MQIDETTVAVVAAKVGHQLPVPHELKIGIDDCVIAIAASSEKINRRLEGYFSPFILVGAKAADVRVTVHETPIVEIGFPLEHFPAGPGKTRTKEAFADLADGRIVRKRQTGLVFVFGAGRHLVVGPCLENLNQVINFINTRFIDIKCRQGGLLGHAAGVCWGNAGLALAGFSGTGKSSLALKLLSRGADFVSNDRLILSKAGARPHMTGVAKHPRVNPGTLLHNADLAGILPEERKSRYQNLTTEALWQRDEKYDVPIETVFSNSRFVLKAPMHALGLLNWRLSDHPPSIRIVDPLSRRDLLPALMKSAGVFSGTTSSHLGKAPDESDYLDVLSACDVFEVSGGIDFDTAADFFLQYLQAAEQTMIF